MPRLLVAPLLSQLPGLLFEFLSLLVETRDQGCRFRIRRVQQGPRLFHDAGFEAQALRDVERAGFSRQPAQQPVSGLESQLVELHGRVERFRRFRGVGLQARVVRGHQRHGAALAKVLENGHGQRRAFVRLRAGPQLIHQHHVLFARHLRHPLNVLDVRRKRAQVGFDGLLVADIRQHAPENRQLELGRRHGDARLRHQHGASQCFQGYGLSAGVRPADDHHDLGRLEFDAQRHGTFSLRAQRLLEQRMPGILQREGALGAEFGDAGVVLAGKFRLGKGEVQFAQNLGGPNQVVAPLPELAAEFAQDALDFGELPVLEFHQFVVQGQSLHGLEKHGCPGRTRSVNHALHAALLLCPDGNDEAVVAQRHHGILKHALAAEVAQQALQHGLHFDAQPLDRAANPRQFRDWRRNPPSRRDGSFLPAP